MSKDAATIQTKNRELTRKCTREEWDAIRPKFERLYRTPGKTLGEIIIQLQSEDEFFAKSVLSDSTLPGNKHMLTTLENMHSRPRSNNGIYNRISDILT